MAAAPAVAWAVAWAAGRRAGCHKARERTASMDVYITS